MSKYECYILGDGGSRVPVDAAELKRLVLSGSISGDTIIEVNGKPYLARKIVKNTSSSSMPSSPTERAKTPKPACVFPVPPQNFTTNRYANTAIWSLVVIVALLLAINVVKIAPTDAELTTVALALAFWLAPWFWIRRLLYSARVARLASNTPPFRTEIRRATVAVLTVSTLSVAFVALIDCARHIATERMADASAEQFLQTEALTEQRTRKSTDFSSSKPASAQTYSPPEPELTSELEPIFIEAPSKIVGARPSFRLKTNLPNGTKVMIALVDNLNRRGTSTVVSNGVIETTTFSNLGDNLQQGEYRLEISTPVVQSPEILAIVGERGENYRGSLVSEIDFFGSPARVIEAQAVVTVEESATSQTAARQHSADFDVEAAREEAVALYDELIEFKSAPTFHQVGFGSGGPYNQWLESQQALSKRIPKGTPIGSEISNLGIAVGYLQTCAFEYMKSRGQETDFTKTVMSDVRAALNR